MRMIALRKSRGCQVGPGLGRSGPPDRRIGDAGGGERGRAKALPLLRHGSFCTRGPVNGKRGRRRMSVNRGYQFFQNPGPTNIPDRVLRAMSRGAIDFTGREFRAIAAECFAGLRRIFKTEQAIVAYAASGHGAWEAALSNLFSPGDRLLLIESGYFSLHWGQLAEALGLAVETLPTDWRDGADPAALEARLREDRAHALKGVLVVHNETSTGVANRIAAPRHRRRPPSGAFPGRCDLLARLDRFPHGRVAGRRGRRRLAERADAALRHGLHRGRRARPPRRRDGETAADLLGLAPLAARSRTGFVQRHRAGPFLLRPAGSAAHDRGGGSRSGVPPASSPGRGDAARGCRMAGQ